MKVSLKKEKGNAIIGIPILIITILIAWSLISIFLMVIGYRNLTLDEPIMTLFFEEVEGNSNQHKVKFLYPSNLRKTEFVIHGDQWRVDAKFLKMKSFFSALGLSPRYALERIEGRYSDINLQNKLPSIAYELDGNEISVGTLFGWSPFIDSEYGSSTYLEIKTGYDFIVHKTNTGIIARKEKIEASRQEECSWYNKLWCKDE